MDDALIYCESKMEHCNSKAEECLKKALEKESIGDQELAEIRLQWAISWEERALYWRESYHARIDEWLLQPFEDDGRDTGE